MIFKEKKIDLNIFLYEIKILIESGISTYEALNAVIVNRNIYAEQLTEVLNNVKVGHSLSDAMGFKKELFPDLLINIVKSTESSGDLASGLNRYLDFMDKKNHLKNVIISASIYPILIFLIGIMICIFLLIYLAPRFADIYSDSSTNLNGISFYLIKIGTYLSENIVMTLAVFLTIIYSTFYVRENIFKEIVKNRFIKNIIGKINIISLYRALAIMIENGYPLKIAIEKCLNENDDNKEAIINLLNEGKKLSDVFFVCGLTTPISLLLIQSGESNGNTSNMLLKSADYHESEIENKINIVSKIIEPVFILIVGLMVGLIVIFLYLPIFDLVESV